jgi:hypothetical protein
MYKKIVSKKGKEMWYKDGKMVSKNDVPVEELDKSFVKDILDKIDPEPDELKPSTSTCIMCDGPNEHQRNVRIEEEVITVTLCDYCYYDTTLGDIVSKVTKEKNNERK